MGVRKITLPTGPALGWAPPTIAEEHDPKDQPQLAEGPPWLIAHPLFDGDSTLLNEFFQSRIHDLGEASGGKIFFWDIGNPRQHDAWYEEVVSKELKARGEKDADEYQKEIDKLGKEEHYILREVKILREALGVRPGEVPCIAFRTQPIYYPVPSLQIQTHWYSTQEARVAFSKALQEWLSGPRVRQLITPEIEIDKLARTLAGEIEQLGKVIDERVQGALMQRPKVVTAAGNVFKRDGQIWKITYEGETIQFPDLRGLQYIAYLVSTPGHEFHAVQLRSVLAGHTRDQILESLGLSEDQEGSGEWEPDPDARSHEEGLSIASESERARKAVSRAINRAMDKIRKSHPTLWRHLSNSLKTGAFLSYSPETSTEWET